MPAKNTVKIYIENGIYHVYNRGVEKRCIFQDEQDYKVFLKNLKETLSTPTNHQDLLKEITFKGQTFKGITRQPKNYHSLINLYAYCLMPNHFHLLISQTKDRQMDQFMQSISARYAIFFNKKYKRKGSLFETRYKASLIDQEPYLLHITRYIHLNPQKQYQDLTKAYSSYADYLKIRHTTWINTNFILDLFKPSDIPSLKNNYTYKNFVEDYSINSEEFLGNETLEDTL